MINYDSILSAFDGKPTLLQWLKMVKKALDESILKNVDITQNGEKVVFSFNFEDGTSISTPEVTLPKGDKGDTGATGPKGNDGVSITGINTVGSEVVGDETLTTLRSHYSNDTTGDFVVTAKNGKDAGGGANMYLHSVILSSAENINIYFNVYSRKQNILFEDAMKQFSSSGKIPVVLYGDRVGVVSANKQGDKIKLEGVVCRTNSSNPEYYLGIIVPKSITDILLGENL